MLLLQLEIPLDAVMAAARAGRDAGAFVVLDPAPARPDLPDELLASCDLVTPNEAEAEVLCGQRVTRRSEAFEAAARLRERGARHVVVTLGQRGAIAIVEGEGLLAFPALPVTVVDTVAAGDAFNGAAGTALASGLPLRDALRWGSAAGALACTRPGAMDALPGRAALEQALSVAEAHAWGG